MYSKKLGSILLLISFAIGLIVYLLNLSSVSLRTRRRMLEKTAMRRRETTHKSISKYTVTFSENSTENLCLGNLLDKREHHYAKEADGSYDNSRLISKFGSCQLLRYTFEQVVDCFDSQHFTRNSSKNSDLIIKRPRKNLHFAFIGDSRIRQQFLNFLKLIPDYDRKSHPSPIPARYHGDIEVTSDILRLRLSFQWRPLITDTVINTVRQWTTDSQTDPPNLVLLGIAVWHMLQSQGADHQLYQKKLKELAPILGQLGNVSQVIWLNQYPTVEFYGKIDAHNTDIFSEKIHYYNQAVRRILGVQIWDSSNPLAEEYVRACALSQRSQLGSDVIVDPAYSYVNCEDYTHAGYSALSQATQLLLNYLCNANILYE